MSNTTVLRKLALLMATGLALGAGSAAAGDGGKHEGKARFCSTTAELLFQACRASSTDDLLVANAKCTNVSLKRERDDCFAAADETQQEDAKTCREQRNWRLDACALVGEGRYDPKFDAAGFDDPMSPAKPNPYFPLTVGNQWLFRSGEQETTVTVLNETKLIDDVHCITVHDRVVTSGDLREDTNDWYAQAKDGNTWYCGEETAVFESFDGDQPRRAELVTIDGSFKAGRAGDKPGIIFQASPKKGQAYLEEFSLANAEDITVILSTSYAFGRNPELDRFVPQALAERFCSAGDCVVTNNFSLLEPHVFGHKYYARGIGVFLELDPDTGEVEQLVSCNFDARCAGLPTP